MRKTISLVFLALFIILATHSVVAADTTIRVLAYPSHEIQVNILRADTSDLITTLYANSSESGESSVTYSGGIFFNLYVMVRRDGKIIKTHRGENQSGGGVITIDLLNEPQSLSVNADVVLNETNATPLAAENTSIADDGVFLSENQTATNANSNNKLRGMAIFENLSLTKYLKFGGYILGGIVLAFIVVFFAFKFGSGMINRAPKSQDIRVVKLSDKINEQQQSHQTVQTAAPASTEDIEQQLREAGERLKNAQNEINRLKNQDRIRELERRMEEERNLIEKLKSGDSI